MLFNLIGMIVKHLYPIGIAHIMFGVILVGGYYLIYGFQYMFNYTTILDLGIGSLIVGASISVSVLIFAGLALHLMKYFAYTDQVNRAVNKE